MKRVQHEERYNMNRVRKRYNIKTLQHEKRCDMKREYHEKKFMTKIL